MLWITPLYSSLFVLYSLVEKSRDSLRDDTHDQVYWFYFLSKMRMEITQINMSESQAEKARAMEEEVLNGSTVADAFRVITDLAFK